MWSKKSEIPTHSWLPGQQSAEPHVNCFEERVVRGGREGLSGRVRGLVSLALTATRGCMGPEAGWTRA